LKNILYSGFDFKDNDKSLKYKFQLINTILIIAILSSLSIAFLFIFIGTHEEKILVITLEFFYASLHLALFIFLKFNKKNLKTVIYISMISLYILQVIIMINLIEDSLREAWYFLTIILSFFLGGKKFGYLMLSLIFLTMIIYNFQTVINTNLNNIESIVPIVLLLLIGFIMNLYETTKENYEQSLQEANSSLEDKIEELNQFNINLEDRIQKEIKKNSLQERKLFEQAKMASMGEMIGNIAHQWRQPLTVISMTSTGAKMQKEMDLLTDEMFSKDMETINDNVQYLSKTIDDFRNFTKGDRVKKVFNLKDDINSFLHLVEGSIKNYHINLVLDLNDTILINGYPNELIQCFINIFNNSKDALLEIPEENRFLFISTHLDKDNVIITFKDSAGGIPFNVLPKIFDPYFTTKHQSQGTGLGLHMTHQLIVDGMNGTIEAKNINYEYKNKKYKGAKFTIKFLSE
jgi:signal transduction histidine kinase